VARAHLLPILALAAFSLVHPAPAARAQERELLPAPKVVIDDDGKQDAPKKEEVKKDEPKKDEVKKEEPKKDEAKKEDAKADESKGWDVPVLQAKKAARDTVKTTADEAKKNNDTAITYAKTAGDNAWMLTASALVMLMVPGLALFYGGMVRKKNVLATMMQSYAALSVVGLYWVAFGYSLAFGQSAITVNFFGVTDGGLVGWNSDLVFLHGIKSDALLPGYNIPVYTHVMFQGMFAIITPALISGALAERIRFWPFCLFMIIWVTFVYCPLAHMVWAFDWFYTMPADPTKDIGASAIGLLGKMGALDFAGGTVVHIAAGTAGLAAALVLRKRVGYPGHTIQPNSMVLTLIGAGLLWFGWFGFNGGSSTNSTGLSASAFAATQAAAAGAGLSWILVEWLAKGKPTALGLASGIVAGLVAVTPASGFVTIWGGAAIGLIAGVVCYCAVMLKSTFKYDDSLDAFGVHAIGGFLGAVLTGLFCYAAINSAGADGYFAIKGKRSKAEELKVQFPDYATLFEIDDLTKKGDALKADIDKAGIDAENAKLDIDAAKGEIEGIKADLEKVKADKKEADAKTEALAEAEKKLKAAKEALEAAEKKQKDAEADVKKNDEALAKVNEGHKKSDATKRLEELDKLIKEKDEPLTKAKTEREDAVTAMTGAADAARKAADKGGKDSETAAKAFEEAKKKKEEKDKEYQKVAAEVNGLKAEQKKLTDGKADLKKIEDDLTDLYAKDKGPLSQFGIQLKAALFATFFAFGLSLLLALFTQVVTGGNFTTTKAKESEGLDLTEHGEIGFDLSVGYDSIPTHGSAEPKAAKVPPGMKRFDVVVEGVENGGLMKAWSELCQPSEGPIDADFQAVYPYVTTVQGNRFRLRGGDPAKLSAHIQKLFSKKLGKTLKVRIEE
jgi:Amt family ammonium transporter